MAGNRSTSKYLLEEPTTGLYIIPGVDRARLTKDVRAAGFAARSGAILAANAHLADQPHELVRIDA